ncbi:MAG: M56 family metallopeptidase [Flavobacteriaceae bacterium]|nr:M56 family metallopeptidase [Flavobacteriaceae bacterium]
MELYLLKSGACLAILFVFYKLILENENMHQFKRIYLLGMLVVSFGIPIITFTTYIEVLETTPINFTSITSETQLEESTSLLDYLPSILWTVYFIGVAFFSFRFIKNIFQILIKINQNQKVKFTDYINVLLTEKVIPHTFFSYIFLNKQKYDLQEIPSEVMLHEQTHAKQKHSFDVLFIELLQIVFWFNPFLYFIKHSIKLNHEFLADQAVLNQGIDSSLYQNILLAFSSDASTPQMANSINYSFIKKRFTVMKTHTSTRKIWFRSLLLLPLLAVLTYSFSTKETLNKPVLENDNLFVNDFYLKIDSEENIYYNNEIISFGEIPNAIKSYKETYPNEVLYFAKIDVENKETTEKLFPFIEIIKENGIENVTACWVKNDNLKISSKNITINIKNNKSFTVNGISATVNELPNILAKFNQSLTKEERSKFVDIIIISEDSVPMEFITNIQEILIDYGINKIRIPGSISDVPLIKKGATKSQLAEYNKLAKKYNKQDKENRVVLMKDLERLEYLYNLMTDEQKANAEPFPDCFPPPPPFVSLKPLDHIIKMAKNNAAFFYENERIPSNKAISLIKENNKLNIETTTFKNSNPIVKITKNGVNNTNIPTPPAPPVPIVPEKIKTGSLKINGVTHYYSTKNGVTKYYNKYGDEVDKNGKMILH